MPSTAIRSKYSKTASSLFTTTYTVFTLQLLSQPPPPPRSHNPPTKSQRQPHNPNRNLPRQRPLLLAHSLPLPPRSISKHIRRRGAEFCNEVAERGAREGGFVLCGCEGGFVGAGTAGGVVGAAGGEEAGEGEAGGVVGTGARGGGGGGGVGETGEVGKGAEGRAGC